MKLYIDSSTSYLYLALLGDSKKASYLRFGKNDHSETLVDNLAKFLKEQTTEVNEISEVLIGRGPGSYTGVRIAGTVGKVMCYITKKTLKSFSSLDLLLASKLKEDGKYIAKIIAKNNHSYIKAIELINGKINVILDDSFVEDIELEKYQDYQMIEPSEEVLSTYELAEEIEKNNLTKEESVYDYVPNYLRSGI